MTQPVLAIGTEQARAMRVYVPWTGLPVGVVHFDHEVALTAGTVVLTCAGLTLSGVIDQTQSGDFALSTHATFLGGAGGWRAALSRRTYHNDAGVSRTQVAVDAAGEVGELLTVDPSLESLMGADYVRAEGLASELVEGLFPGAPWWVDAAGKTNVGTRPIRDVSALVQILEADPRLRTCVLVADDFSNVLPGCSVTDPRLGTFLIHDVDIFAAGGKARAYATESGQRDSRVLSMLDGLILRNQPRRTYERGPYRFRVITMTGDRVNLQPVNQDLGLDNLVPVGMAPGMAGLSAQLQPGAIVLVDFIEGDPALPIITHFSRKDDPGFLPVSVTLDATTINIGPNAATVNVGNSLPGSLGPAYAIRNGEQIIISGAVVAGGSGSVVGTIGIGLSEGAPGPPGSGHSRAIL